MPARLTWLVSGSDFASGNAAGQNGWVLGDIADGNDSWQTDGAAIKAHGITSVHEDQYRAIKHTTGLGDFDLNADWTCTLAYRTFPPFYGDSSMGIILGDVAGRYLALYINDFYAGPPSLTEGAIPNPPAGLTPTQWPGIDRFAANGIVDYVNFTDGHIGIDIDEIHAGNADSIYLGNLDLRAVSFRHERSRIYVSENGTAYPGIVPLDVPSPLNLTDNAFQLYADCGEVEVGRFGWEVYSIVFEQGYVDPEPRILIPPRRASTERTFMYGTGRGGRI